MEGTRDEVNRVSSEFRDNGVSLGELGEMTSQSDVGGVEWFEEGFGRVRPDAMV